MSVKNDIEINETIQHFWIIWPAKKEKNMNSLTNGNDVSRIFIWNTARKNFF